MANFFDNRVLFEILPLCPLEVSTNYQDLGHLTYGEFRKVMNEHFETLYNSDYDFDRWVKEKCMFDEDIVTIDSINRTISY